MKLLKFKDKTKTREAIEHMHDFDDINELPPKGVMTDISEESAYIMTKWTVKNLAKEIECFCDSDLDFQKVIRYNVRTRAECIISVLKDIDTLLFIAKDMKKRKGERKC